MPGASYKWLGWSREREVFKICIKHFNAIAEVVKRLKEFVYSFKNASNQDMQKYFHIIFEVERQADSIKEDIIKELSRGPIHPIDREDIIRLIITADDIASYAKAAARKLLRVDPNLVPDDIKSDIVKMVELSLDGLEHLSNAINILIKNPSEAIKESSRVERVEEMVDDFRDDLMDKILRWGDTLERCSRWIMVKEAVEDIEDMVDRMEDTADVVRGLAVTS